MSLVVDTNVLAYHFLRQEPYCGATGRLFERKEAIIAPDLWRSEYLNIMWRTVRSDGIDLAAASDSFPFAEQLVDRTVSAKGLWGTALRLAVESNLTGYDALYVALARREHTFLATYDQAIRKEFPAVAKTPEEIVEA